jgi:biopolymer transport protein TolQ
MNEIIPAASHDMSFLGLFLQADPIVKSVMILLVLASLGCWTIVFEKLLRFRDIRRQARAFEAAARSGERLHPQMAGATGRIVSAGHEAWRDQDVSESRAERRERI